MFNNISKIILTALLAAAPLAARENKTIKGKDYSGESRQTSVSGDQAMLKGLFSYGAAVYQFQLPAATDRIKAGLSLRNLKNKWLKIYVYNYGTAYDDLSIRNKRLSPNWRLWEATNSDGLWESRSPQYLYTTSYDGRIDYLGPQNIFKILLYAEGGIPFISDGRFIIEQILLDFSTGESLLPDIATSKDVWIEGNFMLVRGVGRTKNRIDAPGYEALPKLTALRLAKVDAYKKLALALKKIPLSGGTAAIPGSQVRSTRYISDSEVEIILEVPLASLHEKNN
ncbi:MAG: hypothetical protein RDU76_05585 [Candidatus Edwardsbacteria bacterium]|nr:hypothetical protein [Candidatus Edwardsbacteria bacterium]